MVDLESITDQIVTVSLVTKTEFWGLITELGKTIFKTCWKRLKTFSSLTEITISYERLFFLFSVLHRAVSMVVRISGGICCRK